ncbi:hypothetical protein OAO87_00195 [bacterium]|nr:hypothetical protein [bacterium]
MRVVQASYIKSSETLKLKVRTLLVGGGVPEAFRLRHAHYDGYMACKTLPELRQWIKNKQLAVVMELGQSHGVE